MKRFALLLTLIILANSFSYAQLSKDEKKRIKKELKAYKKDPASYKKMITGYKKTIDDDKVVIRDQKNELVSAAEKQASLEKKIAKLEQELDECMKRPIPVCPTPGEMPAKGTVYKVQFGFYEKFDITGYFTTPKYVGFEKVEDKYKAYSVSYFDTEQQAEQFRNDLKKLGIKDAFVTKYENRVRIYEWEKNPKYKGKPAPAKLQDSFPKQP